MFKNAIVAARDRKTQAWFLLASLICFLILASVAVAFFWRRNGPQHALSIIINLISAEIALLLSICTSLVQMTTQIYCMCKGRPILTNSRGKRAMIILLSIPVALMLLVQGTTGAVHSSYSFFQQLLPPVKSDFKTNLSMFTWAALVAVNLIVIIAVPASTSTEDGVESGGTLSGFLPPAHVFPGPLSSLALRGLQYIFAVWSLCIMRLSSDYKSVKTFVFLFYVLASQCLWTGMLAIVGLCTLWGYGSYSRLLYKPWVRTFVCFGDLVMVSFLFHAACGAASIVTLLKFDLDECFENNCESYAKFTTLSLASYITLLLPSVYTTIKRVYT